MPGLKIFNLDIAGIKTINGYGPDEFGNINVSTSGEGGGYSFKEETFLYKKQVYMLQFSPIVTVPATLTVNGLVQTAAEFTITNKGLTLLNNAAEINDIVRIYYAY